MKLLYAAITAVVCLVAMAAVVRLRDRRAIRNVVTSEMPIMLAAVAISFGLFAAILVAGLAIGEMADSATIGIAGGLAATAVAVAGMFLATRTRQP